MSPKTKREGLLASLRRVVIAVDPSGCAGENDQRSDEVGIVAAGVGHDGIGRILEDATVHYVNDTNGVRRAPLVSGLVLLSPRQKRFLAHVSSNPGAQFGNHPPLASFLKDAIRSSYFTATLLEEPGLIHYELGWPNILGWRGSIGPLEAEFRGGAIFRVSSTEIVAGASFQARGSLDIGPGALQAGDRPRETFRDQP